MIKKLMFGFVIGLLSGHENYSLTNRKETVVSTLNLKIVQLSDIHYPYQNITLKGLLRQCQQMKPDIICLTGDLYNDSVTALDREFKEFLTDLVELATVVTVLGNHEVRVANHQILSNEIKSLGIHLLRNEVLEFKEFRVYGVDELNRYEVIRLNDNKFNLILAHHPEDIKRLARFENIDLVLAGHAHGGQIRIGRQGFFAPRQGIFPQYTKGLYSIHGKMKMNVSAGIGRSKFKQRVNNRPEIVFIQLIDKE